MTHCSVCHRPLSAARVHHYPLQWQHSGPMHCQVHESRPAFLPLSFLYRVEKRVNTTDPELPWRILIRERNQDYNPGYRPWKDYFTPIGWARTRRGAMEYAAIQVSKLYHLEG